jgi:hypothetical protein
MKGDIVGGKNWSVKLGSDFNLHSYAYALQPNDMLRVELVASKGPNRSLADGETVTGGIGKVLVGEESPIDYLRNDLIVVAGIPVRFAFLRGTSEDRRLARSNRVAAKRVINTKKASERQSSRTFSQVWLSHDTKISLDNFSLSITGKLSNFFSQNEKSFSIAFTGAKDVTLDMMNNVILGTASHGKPVILSLFDVCEDPGEPRLLTTATVPHDFYIVASGNLYDTGRDDLMFNLFDLPRDFDLLKHDSLEI